MKRIEIFKAGTHTSSNGQKVTITQADLQAVVDNYNIDLMEAPIVVGHPKDNGPAFGWIKDLELENDSLYATPDQVNKDFAELVKNGSYKKVSASFYGPDSPSNPKGGSYYLRHLGFLGGQPPALKGLEGIQFNEADEGVFEFSSYTGNIVVRFLRNMREHIIKTDGIEAADRVISSWDLESLQEENVRESVSGEEVSASFTEEKTEKEDLSMTKQDENLAPKNTGVDIKEREAFEAEKLEFAEEQAKARKVQNQAFVKTLITEGKVTPAQSEGLSDFMESLDVTEELSFGEAEEKQSSSAFFKSFLNKIPKQVEFGEIVKKDETLEKDVNFAAPEGFTVDAAQLELMGKAETYAQENGISVDDAITLLEGK